MKLNGKRTVLVGLAFLSICAFWQVYDNIVPLILENTFGFNAKNTGLIMGIDNLLALFMLPLFGALSDRTHTKIGKRMPYILAGTAAAAAAAAVLPLAGQLKDLALFIAALFTALVAMNSYRSPAVALMPDVTVKPLRSKANAVINLMGALGGALVLGATPLLVPEGSDRYMPLFLSLAGLMVISAAVLALTVSEPRAVSEMRRAAGEGETGEGDPASGGRSRMEPDKARSFALILLSVFLWFMGYNAVTTGFTRYADNVWGKGVGNASAILLVAQIAAIAAYIPVGEIATRIGRKKTILCGILMLSAAFGSSMLFRNFSVWMFIFFALAGVGWAFINVNSYPMVVDLCRGAEIGRYTGYYYLFSMAAQSVTPYFSGVFIDLFGYRAMFPYGCLFVALSFVTMLFVRHGDSRPPRRESRLEAFDAD